MVSGVPFAAAEEKCRVEWVVGLWMVCLWIGDWEEKRGCVGLRESQSELGRVSLGEVLDVEWV